MESAPSTLRVLGSAIEEVTAETTGEQHVLSARDQSGERNDGTSCPHLGLDGHADDQNQRRFQWLEREARTVWHAMRKDSCPRLLDLDRIPKPDVTSKHAHTPTR